MPRISPPAEQTLDEKTKKTFEAVKKQLGVVPNMFHTMAASPAVLDAYLGFSSSLAGGTLSARLREQIALAVGEANGCDYCLAAHTALGKGAGLSETEIADSRLGRSQDEQTNAALAFARSVVSERGHVSDADIEQLRAAGFADGEVAELTANVALNLFTNYFNHVADTEVDFPKAASLETAAAGA